jgi:hypothetical protein
MTWMSTTIAPMSGQSVLMAVYLIEQHSVDMDISLEAMCAPVYSASAPISEKAAVTES